jgi:hypothetical protein
MTKEALKLALEALEHEANIGNDDAYKLERDVIKEALAQPEQKSVAMADYMALTEKYVALKAAQPEQERFLVATIGNWGRVEWADGVFPSLGDKMYSAPHTWVGLTLDERIELAQDVDWAIGAYCEYAEKIEAKLKEKNT